MASTIVLFLSDLNLDWISDKFGTQFLCCLEGNHSTHLLVGPVSGHSVWPLFQPGSVFEFKGLAFLVCGPSARKSCLMVPRSAPHLLCVICIPLLVMIVCGVAIKIDYALKGAKRLPVQLSLPCWLITLTFFGQYKGTGPDAM